MADIERAVLGDAVDDIRQEAFQVFFGLGFLLFLTLHFVDIHERKPHVGFGHQQSASCLKSQSAVLEVALKYWESLSCGVAGGDDGKGEVPLCGRVESQTGDELPHHARWPPPMHGETKAYALAGLKLVAAGRRQLIGNEEKLIPCGFVKLLGSPTCIACC